MTLATLTKITTVVVATSALGACDWLYTPPPAQIISSEVPVTQPVVAPAPVAAPAQTAEEARIERNREWVEQQRRADRNDRPSRDNDRDNDRDDDDDDNWG